MKPAHFVAAVKSFRVPWPEAHKRLAALRKRYLEHGEGYHEFHELFRVMISIGLAKTIDCNMMLSLYRERMESEEAVKLLNYIKPDARSFSYVIGAQRDYWTARNLLEQMQSMARISPSQHDYDALLSVAARNSVPTTELARIVKECPDPDINTFLAVHRADPTGAIALRQPRSHHRLLYDILLGCNGELDELTTSLLSRTLFAKQLFSELVEMNLLGANQDRLDREKLFAEMEKFSLNKGLLAEVISRVVRHWGIATGAICFTKRGGVTIGVDPSECPSRVSRTVRNTTSRIREVNFYKKAKLQRSWTKGPSLESIMNHQEQQALALAVEREDQSDAVIVVRQQVCSTCALWLHCVASEPELDAKSLIVVDSTRVWRPGQES